MTSCTLCGGSVDTVCSPWRWLVDFFKLYFVGILELLRQWFLCSALHSPEHLEASEQLPGFRKAKPLVVLTGCTSGIGLEILRQLSAIGLVIIALTHAADPVLPVKCEQITLDFTSKSSTESGCAAVSRHLEAIDYDGPVILIHCAAIFHPKLTSACSESPSSVITTLNVNFLMPCLLVKSIDHLLSGVIWIGSSSHAAAPRLHNARCPLHLAKTPFSMYPSSKLLCVVYAEHWSLSNGKPVAVIHPGVVATRLYRDERGVLGKALRSLIPIFGWTAQSSARRVLELIEFGSFLELTKRCVNTERKQLDPVGVYWDAVRMQQGILPAQIRDQRKRMNIARKICRALETDVF